MSTSEENLDALCKAFAALSDPSDVKALLADMCTAGETEQIAADFAAGLKSGDVIAYKGPMGAGKTAAKAIDEYLSSK